VVLSLIGKSVQGSTCPFHITCPEIHSNTFTTFLVAWLEISRDSPWGKSFALAALVLLNPKIFHLTHFLLLPHRLPRQVPIMAYNKAVDKFRDIEYPMMQGLYLPSIFSEKIR
jgi:hypothetical protein